MSELIEFDRAHIWHPYTSITDPLENFVVESAAGVRIRLQGGQELIDGMASWWCAIHGYNHPQLNRAVQEQLGRMAHVMFGGLTHEPAVQLAKALIEMTPPPLQQVFFADSGSVAVEVAIKMALQFHAAQGRPTANRLMTIRGGYHGDTFGAMAVCDPVNGMHEKFAPLLTRHLFLDRPATRFGECVAEAEIEAVEKQMRQNHDEIAALILEPIVQGAGGMWFYSADYLHEIAALCARYDILLIADEIATGFGRTGRMFACEHAGIVPDILCLGKALTGGYMTLAATLTTERVARGVSADDGVLAHGPTFMANPLAAAVAGESIRLLQLSSWQQRIASIESQLNNELAGYTDHPSVRDVRVLGAIGVVECNHPIDVSKVQQRFVAAGVWLRPFNNLVYLMPPYIIEPQDLRQLTAAVALALP
ncbi:MAG: adenosylmethionine--8-amino-7-oxononanoate transaminase [Gammaproteobacteria bacterium]|nr:adenosylmethionine--8-amino-7-oxononanoate transaminase [Chromatiales bacterium]MCP4925102.1 adenosylmethionine--8-amino-7-oxononanoate transaminase [Gammaproteobacteria bacterium]MDP7154710.1 adenosylmethionine--8-amino-7-oxononanoate transaminase [Gammaproteobacteria bacterium]MDP7297013.1 adenosylmethionine--8-amino-7-oxononanoate transaminase [Gammaproteobacteria bacterium]MDP7418684.1 adenosylmethionine--8-amino-7-oxononanoate transaminase [Gammaproteobacteria bacterium]